MKQLAIETITKPMKLKNLTLGYAELDGEKLVIDLDKLNIRLGTEHFKLERISGTRGGYRYFFLCPDCGGGAGCFINGICITLVAHVIKYISRH